MTDIVKRSGPQNLEPYNRYHTPSYGLDPSEERLETRRFIKRLLKRKYQILAVMLIVLIPAAIATYLATPLFRSAALIQINPDPVQVLPFREVADIPNAAPYYEVYMKTQEQVLRGATLRTRVVQRLRSEPNSEAMQLEATRIGSRVEILRIENSQLFEIGYLAPVPEVAANIVNIFAEEYIKELFQARQITKEKARKMLQGELAELEQRVQASEKELVNYAQSHNISGAEPGQSDLVEQKLAILANQLTDSEAELVIARSKLGNIRKASIDNFPEKLLTPNLSTLNSKILQLEHELTALRSSYGENWPSVVQKRNEIELVRDQLRREKASTLAQAKEQAQMDYQLAESRRGMMATSLAQQQQLVDRYRNASIQYNILRREVETNQKLYEGLLERLKQTSVTAGLEFGNIQVVETGHPSKVPDSPKVLWIMSLASLLGLALGICCALVLDFWDNSVSTIEEVEQITSLPALGSIPPIKTVKGKALIGSKHGSTRDGKPSLRLTLPRSGTTAREMPLPPDAAEAVRNICASILLSKSDQPPRVILVTSVTPEEGKTTLVNHMGQAFADGGNRTLLIEADMRKPTLAQALGVGSEGGLSLFLSGHISPSPTIHSTSNPNLFMVPAGPKAPNPVALLGSDKLSSFLSEMSSSYQFIIIDAPPILGVADARVLCTRVDGVVLVVKAGRTPRNLIRRAWMLLENSGANVLGMVLNGAAQNGYESSYYNHYYQ